MSNNDIFNLPEPPQKKTKPVDKWLGIGSIVVTMLLFLLGKTPALVIILSVLIFALLIHPVWNFWWVENSRRRQIFFSGLLAVGCCLIGYWAWPVNEQRSAPNMQPTPSLSIGERLSPVTTYMQSLPWRWIAISLAVGFALAAWLFKGVRQGKQAASEAQKLQERVGELEQENSALVRNIKEAREEAGRQQQRAATINDSFKSREHELETLKAKYGWLHELANRDKSNINSYVYVIFLKVDYAGLTDLSPYIEIILYVINASVYDIAIEKNIEDGSVYLNNVELNPKQAKIDGSLQNISRDDRSEKRLLVIKQWLKPTEVERIRNPQPNDVLMLGGLKIFVKGADDSQKIAPQRLSLPYTIPVAPPVDSIVETLKIQHDIEKSLLRDELNSLEARLEELQKYKLFLEVDTMLSRVPGSFEPQQSAVIVRHNPGARRLVPQGELVVMDECIVKAYIRLLFENRDAQRLIVYSVTASLVRKTEEGEAPVPLKNISIDANKEDGTRGQFRLTNEPVEAGTITGYYWLHCTFYLMPEYVELLDSNCFLRVTMNAMNQKPFPLDFDVEWEKASEGSAGMSTLTPRK